MTAYQGFYSATVSWFMECFTAKAMRQIIAVHDRPSELQNVGQTAGTHSPTM